MEKSLKKIIQEEIKKILEENQEIGLREYVAKIVQHINQNQSIPTTVGNFSLDRKPSIFIGSISKKPELYPVYGSPIGEIDLTILLNFEEENGSFVNRMKVIQASFIENGEREHLRF